MVRTGRFLTADWRWLAMANFAVPMAHSVEEDGRRVEYRWRWRGTWSEVAVRRPAVLET